ncbi:MAG TPA: L,D-transpeptidase family protein [Paracoccaceae bacterium]|nr:L,D-transpeptidase family protein [Paracoccaceae bacterium]
MTSAALTRSASALALAVALALPGAPLRAQAVVPVVAQAPLPEAVSAFRQGLAEAAADDAVIAAFYQDRAYAPFWTDAAAADRRAALLSALAGAAAHGLPVARYDADALIAAFGAARTEGDRGRLEVVMTRAFLDYARDVQTGALEPGKVDAGIKREVPVRDRAANLAIFAAAAEPAAFLADLPPASQEYAQLMKARFDLDRAIARGGWGPAIRATSVEPGQSGAAVIELRDRLVALGYLPMGAAMQTYDAQVSRAVQAFQTDHGLEADGVAGAGTVAEMNVTPEDRLKSVIVAMERERWMNIERGKRHIWVNLTDFTAKIIDDGRVTFATRAVVGAQNPDKRTPEFSHKMTYMELNPDWTVPGGIIKRDYLPKLQANPNALRHLQIIDRRGRVVPRDQIDFTTLSASNFPFNLRQAPGDGNALGLVKFMFPNPHAIYLHDTPEKHLFARESRTYSSGCVRLNDPFDFAYELLSRQEADPKAAFDAVLNTGRQERIFLKEPVPIHLEYRTAFSNPKGHMQYRRDMYGRDGRIFEALEKAGVVLSAPRS